MLAVLKECVRIFFWFGVLEFSRSFIYFNAIMKYPEVFMRIDLWTLGGKMITCAHGF